MNGLEFEPCLVFGILPIALVYLVFMTPVYFITEFNLAVELTWQKDIQDFNPAFLPTKDQTRRISCSQQVFINKF